MGVFDGVPPAGGPGVEIVVASPSTRPGLALTGHVVAGADDDVAIRRLALGLVTEVCTGGEPVAGVRADGVDVAEVRVGESVPLVVQPPLVVGASVVPAGARRSFAFSVPVPWQIPITHLRGPLPGVKVGLGAELALAGGATRPVDPVTVYVYPLPAQERVLGVFAGLGFRLRDAVVRRGRIPGVHQTLPFYQEIGFWAAPHYADLVTEVTLTFVVDPDGMDTILGLDRWAGVVGARHASVARLPVRHAVVDRPEWTGVVEDWVHEAVMRHAAAGGHRPARGVRGPRATGAKRGRGLDGTAGGENHDGAGNG